MSINKELENLYKTHWLHLQQKLLALSVNQYTNPFLLSFNETLLAQADLRVMIFGQETKGWGDELLPPPVDIMTIYNKFFCQQEFYKGYGRSSFWKAFRYFKKQLTEKIPRKKSIYFSWNNINKIGRPLGKTGVDAEVRNIERKTFSVIAAEVNLFTPDIVIFLTGPHRDKDIRHHFKNVQFTPITTDFPTRAIARVSSDTLPTKTIRMYHPSYFGGFYKVRDHGLSELIRHI
ncbi:hypothetical protein [Maridesulfovibrio zosterae]|uniref:hypothetical protein n=1 Tax=Maridesulfovibrio zosterae TaxID=82171 RepID=UPI000402007C|nr:hypothetical protein [Maridesulfovibrio zosterae]